MDAMEPGARHQQPSSLTLLVTAALCAASLAWAYRDRADRTQLADAEGRAAAAPLEITFDELSSWTPPQLDKNSTPAEPVVPTPSDTEDAELLLAPLPKPVAILVGIAAKAVDAEPTDETALEAAAEEGERLAEPWPEFAAIPDPDPWTYEPYNEEADDVTPIEEQTVGDEVAVMKALTIEEAEAPAPRSDKEARADQQRGVTQVEPVTPSEEVAAEPFYEDEAATLAAETPRDELLTYTPAVSQISQRVAEDVRAAFSLGRHGALYAARRRFIEVMKVIAEAKDGAEATSRYSTALGEGFAALAEAKDFLPNGAVNKELSVAEVATSHRTPMLRGMERAEWTLPQEAAALYYRYAEQKLAAAVSGEQAGSMALYGLGKTHARLAELEDRVADEQLSLAMYRAAVLAHEANHLAANELGVGLAKVGRYDKAAIALGQSIAYGGGSTVHLNLAHVQHKLGDDRSAAATAQQAERLAMRERAAGEFSRQRGVEWVTPDQLARQTTGAGSPTPPRADATTTAPPRTAAAPEQSEPSAWDNMKRAARRVVVGQPRPVAPAPYQGPAPQYQSNQNAAPVRSATSIR